MAKFVKIIKFKEAKNSKVYKIFNDDNISVLYYMNLLPQDQKIDFYSDENLQNLVISIDLTDDKKLEGTINRSIIFSALYKGYEAVKKNEYPNDISFCA